MDCNNNNCTTDTGRGCRFCNCGNETSATICEGCFKLYANDWLEGYPDSVPGDIFEVRFKNTRKSYFKNINNLTLKKGDIVAVEASPGHDIGIVSLTGDMVAKQMKRVGFSPMNGEFKAIYRKAKPYDIEKWQEAIAMEHETMIRSRQLAKELDLDMKIGDVEYQGDRIKAIFYYIADGRVDFRELIKVFASEFGIKVEMKQIGARQEAGRIGGLGSCGRELCCASWMSSFSSITTNAARTQDISLNPQKLAGQCCKLKCCLVYELDSYIDARKSFPRVNEPLQAADGSYYLVSSDILSRTMSFSTSPDAAAGNITLSVNMVREIIEMNRKGKKPETLAGAPSSKAKSEEPEFVNMVGEESITRFDSARKKSKSHRGGRGPDGRGGGNRNEKYGGNRDGDSDDSRNKKSEDPNRPDRDRKPRRQEGGEQQTQKQEGDRQNRKQGGSHRQSQKQGGSEQQHIRKNTVGDDDGERYRSRDNRNRQRPPKPKPEQ